MGTQRQALRTLGCSSSSFATPINFRERKREKERERETLESNFLRALELDEILLMIFHKFFTLYFF